MLDVKKRCDRVVNPCYKCEKRIVGCHSYCEDYKTFKKEMEKMKEIKRISCEIQKYEVDRSAKLRNSIAEKKKKARDRRYKR